ncbi:hypothetical protein [Brevibacillus massiliensis]|uniref:hypothetical protein n=1 Tax=Brevibacillus massiliensis TaxID=1118054 RepID=UPI000367640A|nr:hypothetical protein [Brevibacillus massiliensis]
MSNLIATLLVVVSLILVPAGFMQVHVVQQIKQELRTIQANAVMKVAAEGTITPANAKKMIENFIQEEIQTKDYRLKAVDVTVAVERVGGLSEGELTYKDEFKVTLGYPKPPLSSFFSTAKDFSFVMYGTMEPFPYDVQS